MRSRASRHRRSQAGAWERGENDDEEICAAADPERTRIAPYTTSLEFDLDLSGYTCSIINLHDRRIWTPPVRCGATSSVELAPFNHDMLFLAVCA